MSRMAIVHSGLGISELDTNHGSVLDHKRTAKTINANESLTKLIEKYVLYVFVKAKFEWHDCINCIPLDQYLSSLMRIDSQNFCSLAPARLESTLRTG